VFAYWNNDVKQYLIDNARCLYEEYRIDGLRFDEVGVTSRGSNADEMFDDCCRGATFRP
jgi:1,4-alpha-glucan branching enzyme